MIFRDWLIKENIEKSIRRKMSRAIQSYLGVKPQVRDFGFEDMSGEDDALFGTPIGYVNPNDPTVARVPEDHKMSALHEILHTSGFLPHNISEMWNEGITQVVAEEIAKLNNLQIPITYAQDTQYVRSYLLPLLPMNLQQFAKHYAKSEDKSEYLTSIIWSRYSDHFSDEEDWGTNTYESMKEMFERQGGYWNPYLEFLVTGR